eukprot:m.48989 g.48989  ORF g.48989 m.48989 type:complete len:371 (+) comp12039_c0_seq2:395-1507(+)
MSTTRGKRGRKREAGDDATMVEQVTGLRTSGHRVKTRCMAKDTSGVETKAAALTKTWPAHKPNGKRGKPSKSLQQPQKPKPQPPQQEHEEEEGTQGTPRVQQLAMPSRRAMLSDFRRGRVTPLSLGGRDLLAAVERGRVVDFDSDGNISQPFGCEGFEARRGLFTPADQEGLLTLIGDSPEKYMRRISTLSQTKSGSLKMHCCTIGQHGLRGGRYNSVLRPSSTVELIRYTLETGQDVCDFVTNLFDINDPFCVKQQLLCQQVTWSCEDLEPHCDRERPDKTHKTQHVQDDGMGDRITSLTLRRPCWLLLRETATPTNCIAVRLLPGDVYTLAGPARWRWQHAILLDEPVADYSQCRMSIVFRILEEFPN